MNGPNQPRTWWRRNPMSASGIVRLKTGFLPRHSREPARRKLWRPPLWLNVFLLGFVLLGGAAAMVYRRNLDARMGRLLRQTDSAPFEIKRIRQDLADRELDERSLAAELDTRLKYARIQKEGEFYILLDTRRRQFAFKYGDKIVREAGLDTGASRVIEGNNGARWTFAPITGAFTVKEKIENAEWTVPEWVYLMNRQKPPDPLPTVRAGLGRYVLVFSDGYLIHSPPPPESPLKGAKPGSFMVPEADLSAVWRRVGPGTRVYVF
jgi:L,D-transpeptidase-like protein